MEKKSSETRLLEVSRDGKSKRMDEVIREEEVVVGVDSGIHKLYCFPDDLEAMIVGNLKSKGINPSFCEIRKIADNEYSVDLSFAKGLIQNAQKCESSKRLTSWFSN